MKDNRAVNRLAKLLFVLIIGFIVFIVLATVVAFDMNESGGGSGDPLPKSGVEVVDTPRPTQ